MYIFRKRQAQGGGMEHWRVSGALTPLSRRHHVQMARFPLIMTVFIGIMLCTCAANVEPICAKKDFMEFITAFSELTVQQQIVCVRFPLKIEGKSYPTPQDFLRSPAAARKFIISKKEAEESGETATPFFQIQDNYGNISPEVALTYV